MRYIVDDVKTATVEIPEKKFPWVFVILGLIAIGTITMVSKHD